MAENILMASGPTVSAVRPGFGSIVTYGFVGISVAVLFYVLVKYIRLRRSRNYGSLKTKVEEPSLADDGDSNDDEEVRDARVCGAVALAVALALVLSSLFPLRLLITKLRMMVVKMIVINSSFMIMT